MTHMCLLRSHFQPCTSVPGFFFGCLKLIQVFLLSCRFAGQTVSSRALVLVSLELSESSGALLTINTEKSVMASMLLQDLKQALARA